MICDEKLLSGLRGRKELSSGAKYNLLSKSAKEGKVQRVRKGVYLDPDIISKFAIASAAVPGAIIAYHSALDFLGYQNQVMYRIHVASPLRFRSFRYIGEEYKWVPLESGIDIHTSTIEGTVVRYTGISRTIIDCLYRPDLSGGYEEISNVFDALHPGTIDFSIVKEMLDIYNCKSLWKKAGYFFELYNIETGVKKEFIELCRERGGNVFISLSKFYESSYIPRWGMMVPKDIANRTINDLSYATDIY